MASDSSSRRTLLGVAGLASLCCVGPGALAVTGGTTVGVLAGLGQGLVVFAVLGVLSILFRLRSDCSSCTR
ncbi:hypothetical protein CHINAEXTREME_11700 [Halobiforma lacisalsi AJ5]|uniref:Uncharacterized protein n=1 Tax=Natronobacterium lacisalsi AJ5 TaxID=358396 RepID=A0A1P8LRH6_NATLA|nr:hypothetical protein CHINAEXTREME_11700 [Halobiforma lacisalsi AJ5]